MSKNNNDHRKDLVAAAKYLLSHYEIVVETDETTADQNLAHAVDLLVIAQNIWIVTKLWQWSNTPVTIVCYTGYNRNQQWRSNMEHLRIILEKEHNHGARFINLVVNHDIEHLVMIAKLMEERLELEKYIRGEYH